MSDNEMQEIARAAFYVTDAMRGVLGEFKIEEDGWAAGEGPRAYAEVQDCLLRLRNDGWVFDEKLGMNAPYTANIRRCVLKKKFPKPIGKRWVTVILAERFGVDCTFTVVAREPWD